ncbi:MAG TPA: glycosyltransferase family 4 protein [Candidatus Saccharimonadales bacterium]|nr:glycosyltransferase family 4 protein [Candidatus Saccharimonadales bacterium]
MLTNIMSIIFFVRLFDPHIGGVEKHVMKISKILIKKGYKITIITEQLEGTDLQEQKERITIYRIPVGKTDWFKKFKIWSELWKLRRILESADVIHCHDVFFWYFPFRFLYFRKPVYTTFHGYESFPIHKGPILIRKISEKLSWGNICIGDFIKKWYGTQPTYVAYGATDTPEKIVKEKFKKDSALFFGRLDEQTGILTYAKAANFLKEKYSKFNFTIVGDGKYKSLLIKKYNVLGFKKNPEKFIRQYHFTFVSRYLSILEALAANRLIFAVYDNPVKEDYLKMAPFAKFIIIESNPKKLAEKVLYYLEHPEQEKKLINLGYNWVKLQTWENLVTIYINLWEGENNG